MSLLEPHWRALESMYRAAPINTMYPPEVNIGEGESTVSIEVDENYHHSAGSLHGSVYFKVLDDAAFFAANSLEDEVFVLTASFTTYLTRPIIAGKITAKGKLVNQTKTQFIAEAILYNEDGKECARGNGIFARSRMLLKDAKGYELASSSSSSISK